MPDPDVPNEEEEFEEIDLDEVEDIDEEVLADDLDTDIVTIVDDEDFEDEDDIVVEEDDLEDEEDEDEDEEHDDETAEALEELENQELQLLDDEANEAMLVDEVAELRAMRREELTMNVDAQIQKPDEFVCQNCFMVKRTSQLANKRKMIRLDCVA